MAYINVPEGVPGIRSLVLFRPETGQHLYELAQVLLRGPSSLTPAERELIAAYTSSRNRCVFCTNSHAAAARCLYGEDGAIVDEVLGGSVLAAGLDEEGFEGPGIAALGSKMKALLRIAGKVQVSGKEVTESDIAVAREQGADDREIHDTVLIAAAFSMFNRYVDGLGSWAPEDPAAYVDMGLRMAEKGYVLPKPVNQ
jgi:uncharacterized peroxidase-related enzyme